MILTKVVWDMTPREKWSERKLSFEHLRTSRCIAWAHIPNDKQKNMDANNHVCIIVGYHDKSKSYTLLDLVKQEVICRRNVVFDDKCSCTALLNSYFRISSNHPFEFLLNFGSTDLYTTSRDMWTSLSTR